MKLNLRISIVASMILMIFFISFTIIGISFFTSRSAISNLFGSYANLISNEAIKKSINFFKLPENALNLTVSFVSFYVQDQIPNTKNHSIVENKVEKTFKYFNNDKLAKKVLSEKFSEYYIVSKFMREQVQNLPEVRSLSFGRRNGDFMMVIRMSNGSISEKYIFPSILDKKKVVITAWIHESTEYYTEAIYNPISGKEADFKNSILDNLDTKIYDPRKRGWYKDSEEELKTSLKENRKPHIHWTEPRIFFTDEVPGVSASLGILNKKNEMEFAIEINIGLITISTEHLSKLKISNESQIAIISEKGEIIALTHSSQSDSITVLRSLVEMEDVIDPKTKKSNKTFNLHNISKTNNSIYKNAMKSFAQEKNGKNLFIIDSVKNFDLSINRIDYVVLASPFPSDFNWRWNLLIITPEDLLLGSVKKKTFLMLGLSFLGVIIGILIANYLSVIITGSLREIIIVANKVRELDLEHTGNIRSSINEINQLGSAVQNMISGLRSFNKYVPSELVKYIIQSGEEANLGGESKELTVFFSDIADFTSISEKNTPIELVKLLGDYLDTVSKVILDNEGTIDKYIGDSVMAFWNAPNQCENHAYLACISALKAQEQIHEFNQILSKTKNITFHTRIGINTGELIVGNMGSQNRMNYTVIGDSVNLASRIEGLNKFYGTEIIISESTARFVKDKFVIRKLDKVAVKGKSIASEIFELIGQKSTDSTLQLIQEFENGLNFYYEKNLKNASECFLKCLEINSNDNPSKIFLERIKNIQENNDSWESMQKFKTK